MSIPRNLGNFADNVNANGKVEVTGINATGTPSASTVLYGNGTWAAAGGGSSQWTTTGSDIYYNTGNVGIGTSSPVGKMQLAQTNNTTINGGAYINLGKSENGVGGYHLIGMGYNTGSDYAPTYMGYVETNNASGTSGDLVFLTRPTSNASTTAPTERMRIDSSGNVGIGGTPDAAGYKLQVLGSTGVTGIQFTRTGAASGNWSISAGGAANTLLFYDQASSAEKARINAYGLGIGGAVPSSGMGITFPATQSGSSDANTLDDYEEGTFTPTITGGTSNPTVTYNANTAGFYTKIGDRVFVNLFVGASAISGGSGELRVALPFTAKNSTGNYAHGATQFRGTSFSWGSGKTQGDSYTTPNLSYLRFQGLANSTSNYDIVVSDFGAGSVIEVTISYLV